MTVVHLTRDFPPHHRGGISAVVEGMVRASTEAGLPCAVVSFDGWRSVRAGQGAPTLDNHASTDTPVLRVTGTDHLERARSFVENLAPKVLHVHHSMLWDFAHEMHDRTRAPVLQTVHVLQAEQNRLRGIDDRTLSLEAQERSFRGAQRVHAPSESVAERLRFFYPEVTERVRVAPFGIFPAQDVRCPAELEPGFVLYVGRFADIKGTVELFEAMAKVHERAPDTRWAIAGGIPENKKSERRWLRRWENFASPDLKDQVRFLGWRTSEELEGLYSSAAVVLCPSLFETFGMVPLEAMRQGAAVVATTAGGLGELMKHGETALLSEPGDVEGFTANILELLGNPAAAQGLGKGARQRVEEALLWSSAFPRIMAIYDELL